MFRRRFVFCFCALISFPGVLLAQDRETREVDARRLFDAGISKMNAAGARTADACQDFQQSVRRYEGVYNWIQVAKCRREQKDQRGVIDYRGAAQAFESARRCLEERPDEYQEQRAVLLGVIEAGLANSRATLILPVQDLPSGAQFWLDGKLLDAKPGSSVVAEVEPHTLRVTAPFYDKAFPLKVISPGPFSVVLPLNQGRVVSLSPPSPPLLPPQPPVDEGANQRRWGYVVGGVGLAGLAVAGVLQIHASNLFASSNAYSAADCENAKDPTLRVDSGQCRSAVSYQHASIGFAIGGGVALVGGTLLVLTAPADKRSGSRPTLTLGVMGLGLQAAGSW